MRIINGHAPRSREQLWDQNVRLTGQLETPDIIAKNANLSIHIEVFVHIRIFYVNFNRFQSGFLFQMVKMCIKKLDGDPAIAVKCLFYSRVGFPLQDIICVNRRD